MEDIKDKERLYLERLSYKFNKQYFCEFIGDLLNLECSDIVNGIKEQPIINEQYKNYIDSVEEYAKYKKLKNDPRVTKVGHFIRNTSLDEFPQFINVLKGDMSLVGPRPYLLREKEDMGRLYDKIITTKPGITGMWQVSGRSEVTFEERLDMDMEYNYNWSLKTDIKLLLKTIKKVVLREGAI